MPRTRAAHLIKGTLACWCAAIGLSAVSAAPAGGADTSGVKLRSSDRTARIAIVIDDLGNSLRDGQRVIGLPGPVVCAILPHTPFSARLAREAYLHRKEVLLHLPMEALDERETGPGALAAAMPALELAMTLDYDLSTVPHAVGINNHMGSLFTARLRSMRLVMQNLRRYGDLFFVDSMTNAHSVGTRTAREYGVPYVRRNVFLDDDRDAAAIRASLAKLVAIARVAGSAVAIGHPYPETLDVLEKWLPRSTRADILLVPVSATLNRPSPPVTHASHYPSTHSEKERALWPPYSFRSPKAAKSLRP